MITQNIDLFINQGTTFRHALLFGPRSGPPTKLDDGRTFKGWIMSKIGGVMIAELQFDTVDQNDRPGVLYIHLPASVTKTMPVNGSPFGMRLNTPYVYDIEVTYPSGDTERAVQGTVLVSPRAGVRD